MCAAERSANRVDDVVCGCCHCVPFCLGVVLLGDSPRKMRGSYNCFSSTLEQLFRVPSAVHLTKRLATQEKSL